MATRLFERVNTQTSSSLANCFTQFQPTPGSDPFPGSQAYADKRIRSRGASARPPRETFSPEFSQTAAVMSLSRVRCFSIAPRAPNVLARLRRTDAHGTVRYEVVR